MWSVGAPRPRVPAASFSVAPFASAATASAWRRVRPNRARSLAGVGRSRSAMRIGDPDGQTAGAGEGREVRRKRADGGSARARGPARRISPSRRSRRHTQESCVWPQDPRSSSLPRLSPPVGRRRRASLVRPRSHGPGRGLAVDEEDRVADLVQQENWGRRALRKSVRGPFARRARDRNGRRSGRASPGRPPRNRRPTGCERRRGPRNVVLEQRRERHDAVKILRPEPVGEKLGPKEGGLRHHHLVGQRLAFARSPAKFCYRGRASDRSGSARRDADRAETAEFVGLHVLHAEADAGRAHDVCDL